MKDPQTVFSSDCSGEPESRDTAIRAALSRQLYSQTKVATYAGLAAAAIVTVTLWTGVQSRGLLYWLSGFVVIQVCRYVLESAFRKAEPQGSEAIRWGNRLVIATAVTQLWWGLLAILAFPRPNILQQFMMASVIVIVAASVAIAHAPITRCYVSSVLLTAVPVIGRFFYEGGEVDVTLGTIGVVFTCALLGIGRAAHKMMFDSIGLTLERNDLIDELQQAGKQLESRIAERTAQLVEANEQLRREVAERQGAEERLENSLSVALHFRAEAEAANSAKTRFLAMMSHEIRTPLNAIIGFSEMMQDQIAGPLNDQQAEFLGYVVDSGRHLLSLVSDILDLTSIEAGKIKLNLSSVDVRTVLEASVFTVKQKALVNDLSLNVSISDELADADIIADEVRLRQILFNLLSNAAKFTPDGGSVTLHAMRQGNDLVITCSDTGIGIRVEDQERIFKAFEQVAWSYSRPYEGMGLGLALTKRLVELHRGRIWVESPGESRGATFCVAIPFE
jgi:signal transduction histidine kinase